MLSPARPSEQEPGDGGEHGEHDERIGQAQGGPAAQPQEQGVVWPELIDHLVVGQHHGEAARHGQHAERGDEWRNSYVGDEDAVDETNQQGAGDGEKTSKPDGVAPRHQCAVHHSR